MSDVNIKAITIAQMSPLDKKVAFGKQRFRSRKAAAKYLEKLFSVALEDAWKTALQLSDKADRQLCCAYIQGAYSWRIDSVVAEITRLEINEQLKQLRTAKSL